MEQKKTTSTIRENRAPFEPADSDDVLLEKVASYYHQELLAGAEAKAHLERWGIDARAIPFFGLGHANRTLGLTLPLGNRLEGHALRERLVKAGVFRHSRSEALRGAIVVPLHRVGGGIENLYGRYTDTKGRGEHAWTNAAKTGLFNVEGLKRAKEIVIAGSVLDALSLWSAGIEHVTALHGADGPLESIVRAAEMAGTKRVTLALQRTPEMQAAEARLVRELGTRGTEILRMVLPANEDANHVLRQPDGRYRLGELHRLAEWIGGVQKTASIPAGATKAARAESARTDANASEPAEHGQVYVMGDRRWRIRGLAENTSRGVLRVNVFVSREDVGFHVDTFDLYSARHRTAFVAQAASELRCEDALVKKDLGQVLLRLEQAQEEAIAKREAPKHPAREMTTPEREDALELLLDPKLLEKVLGAFDAMGIVGERENLLAGYLVGVSRKLKAPLAMVIQSSSAAGKTAVLDAIVSLVPEEDRFSYSAISGQSLYYMGERSLRHRVLSIAEHTGAEKASYALKLLSSSKALTIASTGKDATTGRITSHEYKVEGPVALVLTTTKVELDEELQNRCLVVTIDESPEQTRAVHESQRRAQTLAGIERETRRAGLERLHQNAQRLIRPLVVVNPHANEIRFGDRRVRARRDHRKLLSLIEAIALVHQHQREIRKHAIGEQEIEYIEATREDVERAESLLEALVGSVADDVPPRTRELLSLLSRHVLTQPVGGDEPARRLTFTRREARDALGWGDTQLKTHLRRLVDAELVIMRRAAHGAGVVYELAFDGDVLARSAGGAPARRAEDGGGAGLGRGRKSGVSASKTSRSESLSAERERSHPGVTSSVARELEAREAS